MISRDLKAWLSYIESLHPKSIAMGMDRIKHIIERMQLHPRFEIITVAGTNGKGSTCAILEQAYLNAGYHVGSYSSPHLIRYNERVRVNGVEVSDEELCTAFCAVDKARRIDLPIALTYFEFGTLAAMWHFMQMGIDVAILEIGLGGRLDAVNAFEPSCSIVTSIDLDHQDYLGDNRELIGYEKAGVYRKEKVAICGDEKPPQSLITHATKINAQLKCLGEAFDCFVSQDGWVFKADDVALGCVNYQLPLPALKGRYQINNAACAIAAVSALQTQLPVSLAAIISALKQVTLAGRFQVIPISTTNPCLLILDVAHNPHAAHALAENLRLIKDPLPAKTVAVFAMLVDKDIQGVVKELINEIDAWYVASIDNTRGALASDLAHIIKELNPNAVVSMYSDSAQAYRQACLDLKGTIATQTCNEMNENDKIVAFGSFYTVSNVMQVVYPQSKS